MLAPVPPPIPSRFARYTLAAVASALAFLVRLELRLLLGWEATLPLAVVAVALGVWYGGAGPGLLALILSLLGGIVIFIPPLGTATPGSPPLSPEELLRLSLFALTGAIVIGLTEALRRTAGEWRRAERERETAVLEERNRLAREIHDTLAQGLTGIIVQLEAAEDVLPTAPGADTDEARAHLGRARALARASLAEARVSVLALRPAPGEERGRDLPAALAYHIEQMTTGTPLRAGFTVTGFSGHNFQPLPPGAETDLLRIALEALTNALKHSGASEVKSGLDYGGDSVSLWVRDNGRGFEPDVAPRPGAQSGFGLTAMRERAARVGGRFSVTSAPGSGTEVRVTVPYASAQPVTAASTPPRTRSATTVEAAHP